MPQYPNLRKELSPFTISVQFIVVGVNFSFYSSDYVQAGRVSGRFEGGWRLGAFELWLEYGLHTQLHELRKLHVACSEPICNATNVRRVD